MHIAPKGKQRELLTVSPSTSPLEEEKPAETEAAQDPSKRYSVHHSNRHKANPVPNASVEGPVPGKRAPINIISILMGSLQKHSATRHLNSLLLIPGHDPLLWNSGKLLCLA